LLVISLLELDRYNGSTHNRGRLWDNQNNWQSMTIGDQFMPMFQDEDTHRLHRDMSSIGRFLDNSLQDNSSRTTRRRQLVADNSSQNITKLLILQKILLPLQQHSFHQSRFHFINIPFINPASISATLFSSLPLPL